MTKLFDLEAKARAASGGPWAAYRGAATGNWYVESQREAIGRDVVSTKDIDGERPEADAALIAAASPSTVLALIAVARAAKTLREQAYDHETLVDEASNAYHDSTQWEQTGNEFADRFQAWRNRYGAAVDAFDAALAAMGDA